MRVPESGKASAARPYRACQMASIAGSRAGGPELLSSNFRRHRRDHSVKSRKHARAALALRDDWHNRLECNLLPRYALDHGERGTPDGRNPGADHSFDCCASRYSHERSGAEVSRKLPTFARYALEFVGRSRSQAFQCLGRANAYVGGAAMRRRDEPAGRPARPDASRIGPRTLCLLSFPPRARQLSDGKFFAWRLAASDLQHVVPLAGGRDTRGHVGPAFICRFLSHLRCRGTVGLCAGISKRRHTRHRCIRCDCFSNGRFSRSLPENEDSAWVFLLDSAAASLSLQSAGVCCFALMAWGSAARRGKGGGKRGRGLLGAHRRLTNWTRKWPPPQLKPGSRKIGLSLCSQTAPGERTPTVQWF